MTTPERKDPRRQFPQRSGLQLDARREAALARGRAPAWSVQGLRGREAWRAWRGARGALSRGRGW